MVRSLGVNLNDRDNELDVDGRTARQVMLKSSGIFNRDSINKTWIRIRRWVYTAHNVNVSHIKTHVIVYKFPGALKPSILADDETVSFLN